MYKLLGKSPWKWLLVNRWKSKDMIKIIDGFFISLFHSWTQVQRIASILQALKAFNLYKLLEDETIETFSMGERSKINHEFDVTKVCEAEEVKKYFINPKLCVNQIVFSLDFKYILCFASENILPKIILKHKVSEIIAYPKIHFRIIRVTIPLSQLYIN